MTKQKVKIGPRGKRRTIISKCSKSTPKYICQARKRRKVSNAYLYKCAKKKKMGKTCSKNFKTEEARKIYILEDGQGKTKHLSKEQWQRVKAKVSAEKKRRARTIVISLNKKK